MPLLIARCRALAIVVAAAITLTTPAVAQRPAPPPQPPPPKKEVKNGQEFIRQGLLIVNFTPRQGADMKLGRRAADAVRSRVGKFVDKHEVEIVDGDEVAYRMDRAGYDPDTIFEMRDVRAVGKYMRADEFILASVSNGPAGPRISGALYLFRDERLRQPLPDATAPKLDSAALL
ncbi:MAG TPA: hypothetical protein VHV78_03455, partial [Gemmatimonadaceae bacterium]|nr:hypothetical protein [Gemmatimonadaceae bacterium]